MNAAIKKAFKVKPGSSRALTNKEFIEKLKEIHDKQADTLKQDAPQNNLLPIVSDEISQLIDKINNKGFAIIFGNEGQGIKKDIINMCDKIIKINMNSKCESLNVAVSSGIILYELYGGK